MLMADNIKLNSDLAAMEAELEDVQDELVAFQAQQEVRFALQVLMIRLK